jgi:serine protease Do
VPLVIWRAGKKLTLKVVLGELELAEKENLIGLNDNSVPGKSKTFDKLGFLGEELNDKNKKKYKLLDVKSGILISSVKPNSPAEKAGLSAGMVIIRVGQIEVKSLKVIDDAIKNAVKQNRKAILLLVKIEKGTRFVALELK